jgi:hypothetical protein
MGMFVWVDFIIVLFIHMHNVFGSYILVFNFQYLDILVF